MLRGDSFIQAQAGVVLPTDTEQAATAGVLARRRRQELRAEPLGTHLDADGRAAGLQELEDGQEAHYDLVPQFQVTLNTRQHIMANIGVRIPLDKPGTRSTQIAFYLLWDWFDGGLRDGWSGR